MDYEFAAHGNDKNFMRKTTRMNWRLLRCFHVMVALLISLVQAAPAGTVTFQLQYQAGWNLLSVPIVPDDPLPAAVFNAPAWTWNGQCLVTAQVVLPGKGYWVHAAADGSRAIPGTPVGVIALTLQPGWNLVGAVSAPPAYLPVPLPPLLTAGSLITNGIWGWQGQRWERFTCLPAGSACWIYAWQESTASTAPPPTEVVVAPPTFAPVSGTYTATQHVTLASDTQPSSIRYTLDGSIPTATTGTLYTAPLEVAASKTLKAVAVVGTTVLSTVAAADYVIETAGSGDPTAPVFTPPAGSYKTAQTVTISTAADSQIRYTTDSSVPSATVGTLIAAASGQVNIPVSTTLIAVAFKPGAPTTALAAAFYLIDQTAPTILATAPANDETGTSLTAPITAQFSEPLLPGSLSSTTFSLTAGGVPVAGTTSFNADSAVATFTPAASLVMDSVYSATLTTGLQDLAGNPLATALTWNFTTQGANQVAKPDISLPPGSYIGPQTVTLTTTTAGAQIRYTLDGSIPTASSGTLIAASTGPVTVSANVTLKAMAFKDSMTDSMVTTAVYTITSDYAAAANGFATRLYAATTKDQVIAELIGICRVLGLGVYRTDNSPIVAGSGSPTLGGFYLYEHHVRALAGSFMRYLTDKSGLVYLERMSYGLSKYVYKQITADNQTIKTPPSPYNAMQIYEVYGSTGNSDQRGLFMPRLINALDRQDPSRTGLVGQYGATSYINPLTAFLLAIDTCTTPLNYAGPTWVNGSPAFAAPQRTATRDAATGIAQGVWGVYKVFDELKEAVHAEKITESLNLMKNEILAMDTKITLTATPNPIHYRHNGQGPVMTITATVTFAEDYGITPGIPPKGPMKDTLVSIDYAGLPSHGTVLKNGNDGTDPAMLNNATMLWNIMDLPSIVLDGLLWDGRTDDNGKLTAWFEPNIEVTHTGEAGWHSVNHSESVTISARCNPYSAMFNIPVGHISATLFPKEEFCRVEVEWHEWIHTP